MRCGLGGAACGGACPNASPTEAAVSIRTAVNRMTALLLFLEKLAVVLVVLADEFVDFGQIRAQRESAHDGPRLRENVGIFDGGFVIQVVEIGAMETLDHVQRFRVAEAAGKL